MIAIALDERQRAAVEAPFDLAYAIVGATGSGKSTALEQRAARARAQGLGVLELGGEDALAALAFDVLARAGAPAARVDDVEAESAFARACGPLFALEWDEITEERIDPEVPGLRTPERFMESAFRLIRKLREAGIERDEFLARALAGATQFYAKPPNFADPALLLATKEEHHDSLAAAPAELARQHRREIDLAKILARLYAAYDETIDAAGIRTGRDAVAQAIRVLRDSPHVAAALRAEFPVALVDCAESITFAEQGLLQAIYGDELRGVTLCGDPASAIASFRAARTDDVFALASERIELDRQHRPKAILDLARAGTPAEEAAIVAERVREWIDAGTPPERIAVLFRSVSSIRPYEEALLDRGVAAVASGDVNVFADPRALDALALLWNAYDPFRHDWMLRTLGNPALGLSDASLALLCAEPPSSQAPLFVLDDSEQAPTVRAGRWDPKRDLRLGWNVVRGEQDAALEPLACARLQAFRARLQAWAETMDAVPFDTWARRVWSEGLARDGAADSARARAQQVVLERLLARLRDFAGERPDVTAADVLEYAQRRAASSLESCELLAGCSGDGFVVLASIDAVRGCEYDRVVVAGVRSGSFPRWYVPDAFLFSPRLGMVPRDNAGDARAAHTAKYSYYVFRTKPREAYNARERRALAYALRRARERVLVTASGTPTKGKAAPELFEELRAGGY